LLHLHDMLLLNHVEMKSTLVHEILINDTTVMSHLLVIGQEILGHFEANIGTGGFSTFEAELGLIRQDTLVIILYRSCWFCGGSVWLLMVVVIMYRCRMVIGYIVYHVQHIRCALFLILLLLV